jgi:hypothetical protein
MKSYWFYLSPLKLHGRETADNSQLTQWESKCNNENYICCCPTACLHNSCLSPTGWSRIKIRCGRPGSCSSVTTIRQNERPKDKSSAWVLFCRMWPASEHMHVCFEFALPYQQGAMSISRPRIPRASLYQRKVTKK